MRVRANGITVGVVSLVAFLHGCGGGDGFSTRAANKVPQEQKQVGPESEQGKDAQNRGQSADGGANTEDPAGAPNESLPGQPDPNLAQDAQDDAAAVPAELSAMDIDPCKGTFTNGNILILDFKSGWFAGDGGTFFSDSIAPNCPGEAALSIDYIHITTELVESNRNPLTQQQYVLPCLGQAVTRDWFVFDPKTEGPAAECTLGSLEAYGQVWILSGDEGDELDVPVSSALFQSVLQRLQERSAKGPMGLFLGAGLSNITHANTIARSTLGYPGGLFARNTEVSQALFPSPDFVLNYNAAPLMGVAAADLGAGQFSQAFYPFAGVESIYDYGDFNAQTNLAILLGQLPPEVSPIYTENPKCLGDAIVQSGLTVVARDACNKAIMAHGKSGNIKVFAEGNLARFYGLKDPLEHLSRLAHYLAAP